MLIAAATILIGFIVLIWSADLFVDGAASIAENMGMSPIIIGLTIVSLGTSAPEVLVALNASLSGSGSLAIGNAIGSNIANIGMVLGTTLLIAPLMVHQSCMKKELPLLLIATAGAAVLIIDGTLSLLDGCLLLGGLVLILWRMISTQIKDPELTEEARTGGPAAPEATARLAQLRYWPGTAGRQLAPAGLWSSRCCQGIGRIGAGDWPHHRSCGHQPARTRRHRRQRHARAYRDRTGQYYRLQPVQPARGDGHSGYRFRHKYWIPTLLRGTTPPWLFLP